MGKPPVEINDEYCFRFPSEDDAAVAPHALYDVLDPLEQLAYFTHAVNGVRVSVTLSWEKDDEERQGAAAMLENWASSSGGEADSTTL